RSFMSLSCRCQPFYLRRSTSATVFMPTNTASATSTTAPTFGAPLTALFSRCSWNPVCGITFCIACSHHSDEISFPAWSAVCPLSARQELHPSQAARRAGTAALGPQEHHPARRRDRAGVWRLDGGAITGQLARC